MVWVVNGSRLKNDYTRFLMRKKNLIPTVKTQIFYVYDPEECFPKNWDVSTFPVLFDFRSNEIQQKGAEVPLYCLLPIRRWKYAYLEEIPRKAFLATTMNGTFEEKLSKFIMEIIKE